MTVNTAGRRLSDHPKRGATAPGERTSRSVSQLGFWSASLSAALSAGWSIAMVVQNAIQPVPAWRGARAYADAYDPIHQLSFYPSLFLALTFVVLLSCLHRYAPEDKKVWSLSALALGVLYATMASVNYQIQLVAVRPSLMRGESAGLEMLVQANPHSIFIALANSYAYMCLAMLFAAPIFEGGRLERWIRRLFLAQGPVAVAQLAWSLLDLSMVVMVVGAIWVVGAPFAFVLLAVLFRRIGRATGQDEEVTG